MSLRETARRVLSLLDDGAYVAPSGKQVSFRPQQDAAEAGTRLYTPEQLEVLAPPARADSPAVIEVVDGTSQVAAQRLYAELGEVCLLNYASARNPGGGFLNGAKAQEEDLCRCSGLYPCLLTQMTYYEVNRAQSSMLYTDHIIFSPAVPFFAVDGRKPLLEEPYFASVITAPAPNSGPALRRDPGCGPAIRETFARRWGQIAAVAAEQEQRALVLGAWGCGAFQGDPRVAAETALAALGPWRGSFDRIVFAIPGRGRRSAQNLAVFREVLADA